jgi:hypothetical protein
VETLVWLHEPEMPFEEEDINPDCLIDACKTKCCGCDVDLIGL